MYSEVIWLQAQQYAINLLPVCLIFAIYSLKMVFNTIYYQHLYRYVNSVVVCQNEKKKKPLKHKESSEKQKCSQQIIKNSESSQESINASLNETKKNVKKSIDEAKNQIPRYADVVKNYQEQALESTGKMTDDYIELKNQ